MARYQSLKKNGQIWSLDLFIGIIIIVSLLVFFLIFSLRILNNPSSNLAHIIEEGRTLSDSLMSEGYPANWTDQDVIYLGLTIDDKENKMRLDRRKLRSFYEMTTSDYQKMKNLVAINSDFYIFFEDKEGNALQIDGITGVGKTGVSKDNIGLVENPKNLVKVTRFMIYDSKIVVMKIYLWQK